MSKASLPTSGSSPAQDGQKPPSASRVLNDPLYDRAELIRLEGRWIINGEEEPYETDDEVDDERDDGYLTEYDRWVEEVHRSRTTCPYCSSSLACAEIEFEADNLYYVLWSCSQCAYWQWYSIEEYYIQCMAAASVVKRFEQHLPEGCHAELARQLRIAPERWCSLSPEGLEKMVTAIFRSNYADAEALHVGRPGDGGIDVLFVQSGTKEWLIQAKRRETPHATEGVATLRSLLGAMVLQQRKYGIIATTADHFSYYAKEDAKKAASLGWRIELLDRGMLNRMAGSLLPKQPWRGFLADTFVGYPDLLAKLEAYFSKELPGPEEYDPLGLPKLER